MTLQWITMNPHTKEGLVLAPPVPHAEASYEQTLEWSAVRHLMREVHDAGGGDMNLNAVYIKACERYCDMWEEESQPVSDTKKEELDPETPPQAAPQPPSE